MQKILDVFYGTLIGIVFISCEGDGSRDDCRDAGDDTVTAACTGRTTDTGEKPGAGESSRAGGPSRQDS